MARGISVETLRDRLMDAGLSEALASGVAELVHPNMTLLPKAVEFEDDMAIGDSKLGGRPDLPDHLAWPIRAPYGYPARYYLGEREESRVPRPLSFIAQINLADVAAAGGTDLPLPETGMLSFFYDAELQPWGFGPRDAAGFRLLWIDDPQLSRVDFPPELADPECFDPVALKLVANQSLPTEDTWAVEQLMERLGDISALRAEFFSADLTGDSSIEDFFAGGHSLGGWPRPVQNEMETECQLVMNGIDCGNPDNYRSKRAKQLEEGATDLRLVMQIDSDNDAGWMWGDLGRLYVWMREQDIEARRFDRCWTILQCS